jgi:hypothetical protein
VEILMLKFVSLNKATFSRKFLVNSLRSRAAELSWRRVKKFSFLCAYDLFVSCGDFFVRTIWGKLAAEKVER